MTAAHCRCPATAVDRHSGFPGRRDLQHYGDRVVRSCAPAPSPAINLLLIASVSVCVGSLIMTRVRKIANYTVVSGRFGSNRGPAFRRYVALSPLRIHSGVCPVSSRGGGGCSGANAAHLQPLPLRPGQIGKVFTRSG